MLQEGDNFTVSLQKGETPCKKNLRKYNKNCT